MSRHPIRNSNSPPAKRTARRAIGEDNARQAIVDATERLLTTSSLHTLTVADILLTANVSRATFYFYFRSKHSAAAAVLERALDDIVTIATPVFSAAAASVPPLFRASFAGAIDRWRRHGAILRAAAETWSTEPEIGAIWKVMNNRLVDAAARQIEVAKSTDQETARALAAALIRMNEHCLYLYFTGAEPAFTGDDQLVHALETIWTAVLLPASQDPAV